jgi:four helix bundle protein
MTNAEFRESLERRTTNFAVDVFKLLRNLPYDVSVKIISYQLGKAASSIGANYHEANRAESKIDFSHKISIALKEANETVYWFKVMAGLYGDSEEIKALSQEVFELRNLLQRIVHSTKNNL